MLTQDQTRTAYELLAQSDAAFAAGDGILGSQKLWDAFVDIIDNITSAQGLPSCQDDSDILHLLRQMATPERDYYSLLPAFTLARRFRRAAENDGPITRWNFFGRKCHASYANLPPWFDRHGRR